MENQTIISRDKISSYSVARDVAGIKIVFVNVFMVGEPVPGGKWVLVDAGLHGSAHIIMNEAEALFGKNTKPEAIILTHGHFDHVGALTDLLKEWDVPVYAHPLEMPYLNGLSNYPPPDPAVGGGAMAYMSWMFPKKGIDLGNRVKPLPGDGSVPYLPGWRFIHTPGHAPGHVSFFRDSDRVLIAGDAFVTTNQNSALSVITQKEEVHAPPAYFTIDWVAAKKSVVSLAELKPRAAGTGHGVSMSGEKLERQLEELVLNFDKQIPHNGRYVKQAAVTDERGIINMPKPVSYQVAKAVAGVSLGLVAGATLFFMTRKSNKE
jgi:glyoxylase-like metal-dependent hydrolase (beta-lactamase superfamily II)